MARTKQGRQRRKARQRTAERYQKAREDAQLAGLIETSPAGAVRSERVDPGSQGCQPLPGLIRAHWATPERAKIAAVDELCGLVVDPETGPHVKVVAARLLLFGDRLQWELDNAEPVGKAQDGAGSSTTTLSQ